MSIIEKDFGKYDETGSWPMVYQKIRNESAINAITEEYSVIEAKKPENRCRNRYRDVSPYDHSRVILQEGETDYINASFLDVPDARRRYILTQGPLDVTTAQFWQMIWEQKSKAILMLNRTIEKGTLKCDQYWPLGEENGMVDEMIFKDVGLKVTLLDKEVMTHYAVTTLELENSGTGESREIYHFQYLTWPDFGVPTSPAMFLSFLMAVREYGVLEESVGPAIVHCSAGIGRSGTFCLVDSCLLLVEKTKDMNCIDLISILINMRTCRMGLIQTPDQLRFSYMAIIEGGHRILADENGTLDVLSSYIVDREDSPPTPPVRTTSLSPRPPPPCTRPPSTKSTVTTSGTEISEEPGIQRDYDIIDNRLTSPQVTDAFRETSGQKADQQLSGYEIRRRKREERKKNTEEQINRMREKQRKSEFKFQRRDYFLPIAICLALLIGTYLLYRYY